MNELLQRHGCSNVFTIPEGLKELMSDISREVLRDQPHKIFDYIANYLSVLLITREHGILSVRILDDLCDCRPSVSEHLMQFGMSRGQSDLLAQIIKEEIEGLAPEEGRETVKESHILKKILARVPLDEEMTAQVCQVARNAYRDYWYRKKLLEKNLKVEPQEAWEVAAERTLELYKKTKPSYSELNRATSQIQAAYRGYHVRRNLLRHLKPKKTKRPKVDLPGPPLDIAGSREIDLGPVINVRVREEDTDVEFQKEIGKALHLSYDPMKTITHVGEDIKPQMLKSPGGAGVEARRSASGSSKSDVRKSSFKGMEQPDPLEAPPYKLPNLDDVAAEHRRSTSGAKSPVEDRPSRISVEQPAAYKISFAETTQEKIFDDTPVEQEASKPEPEVPEEITVTPPPPEEAPEVPEDIPDNATDGDSAPEAYDSAPDADDSAGVPTTEEEEEEE